MAPSFRHGKGGFLSYVSSTGGTVNLSSGVDEVTLNRETALGETPTFGDSDMSYVAGLRSASLEFSGHFASTYEEKLSALLGNSTATAWIFGPESTANTRRKLNGVGFLTNFTIGAPVGDKVSMSGTIQVSGAVTSTTF